MNWLMNDGISPINNGPSILYAITEKKRIQLLDDTNDKCNINANSLDLAFCNDITYKKLCSLSNEIKKFNYLKESIDRVKSTFLMKKFYFKNQVSKVKFLFCNS